MSHGRQHIIAVDLPELPLALIAAAAEGPLAVLGEALGGTDVIVSFGDGSVYEYPNVPASIALAVKSDPEGAFGTVRYWPGYRRIR